ncbi:hypothetical protein [Candidatus Palauibacter sp.]|uniref:hypothetical protein n=1 Tax=Candidatus Palauibacter sp. TaxID=3101350 RepID=UPI003D0C163B
MRELDVEIRKWRRRLRRRSTLSSRELDELEDHLRARVDLELESDASLAPVEAYTAARRALGEPAALLREFSRAGQSRWQRLVLAGWVVYVTSFLLPVLVRSGSGAAPAGSGRTTYGYHFLVGPLQEGELGSQLLILLINLPMLLTLPTFRHSRRPRGSWRILGTVGALTLALGVLTQGWPPWTTAGAVGGGVHLGSGFWVWSTSFVWVAAALLLRKREWTRANRRRRISVVRRPPIPGPSRVST